MPDGSPVVLGLSTSGPYCGVALFAGGDVSVARHEEIGKGQAERLMPMIQEVLEEARIAPKDLDALGVGTGPGNFTGIRISVAATRGLALGLGIPAVGVSLLDALALGQDGPVLASIEARRDHLYLQRFAPEADKGPELVALDDVGRWTLSELTCIGSRGEEIAARIGAKSGPARFSPASAIARIAAERYAQSPSRPAPLYLRAADAAPPRDAPPRIVA